MTRKNNYARALLACRSFSEGRCLVPCALYLVSCLILFSHSTYTQGKKKGYYKIDFLKRNNRFLISRPSYTFEYPVYANVVKDTSFDDKAGDCGSIFIFPVSIAGSMCHKAINAQTILTHCE
jgi:hypothetical protein